MSGWDADPIGMHGRCDGGNTMESKKKAIVTVIVIALIVAAFTVTLMVFNKSPDLKDSEFRVIVTGSMDGDPQTQYDIETIPVNSLVAIHKLKGSDAEDVKVGDVIGFYSSSLKGNVYHRVISIDKENRVFVTKGDAIPTTEYVGFDEANGIVVNVNHPAGEVITFLKANALYIILMIIILLAISEVVSYLRKHWND